LWSLMATPSDGRALRREADRDEGQEDAAVPGKLRWNDPPCGREGFDGRAGWEWENGPLGEELIEPDEPWRNVKPGSRWLWDNRQWAVTSFGLEVYSSLPQRRDAFSIRIEDLLTLIGRVYLWPWEAAREPWVDFDAFEECLSKSGRRASPFGRQGNSR
jgi:hypothetical protein